MAAACTAATIGSQGASAWRVMVTKLFTPNIAATPPAAKTASANSLPAAASALAKLIDDANVMSSVNLVAFGFGVGEGEAVATQRAYGLGVGVAQLRLFDLAHRIVRKGSDHVNLLGHFVRGEHHA